ncbi:hypothetical protein [Mesorhizobium sp. M0091]|uniref:hypothetical protein n=1 Tax=Mesorhizobium sp. M0091 TaxID=2956875 RepID=UPI003335837C
MLDRFALTIEDFPERHFPVLETARRLVEHVLVAHLPEALARACQRVPHAAPEPFEPGQVLQIVFGERRIVGRAQPFRQARRG